MKRPHHRTVVSNTFTGRFCCFILCVAATGCSSETDSPAPQQTAKELISDALSDPVVVSILLETTTVHNSDLAQLRGNERITSLLFDNSQITDEGLHYLSEMPNLTQLRIRSTVTDSCIPHLLKMHRLKFLNLPFADFTDEGITELSKHPKIRLLRIGGSRLSDRAMQDIAKMPSLLFLHLINVPITDEALPALYHKTDLQSLYLDDCLTTERGLLDLLKHLPELHLHVNQRHLDRDPHKHDHQ